MPDQPLVKDLKAPRFLHQFDIQLSREVEEETIRIDGDKTITEKTKVTRAVSVPFGLKKPSRFERDEADIYRAVWETRYVDAGIAPTAILLKKYANYGGILSNEQKDYYNGLQRDFLLAETELKRLQTNPADNKDAIEATAMRFVTLRQNILDFQQEQSQFFTNTAEAKARQKLIEWLVLYLTYHRPVTAAGEPGEWVPYFAGLTIEQKLDAYEAVLEKQDESWLKAHDLIELIATVYATGGERDIADVVALDEAAKK